MSTRETPIPGEPERILVLHTGWIGDNILATPLVREAKRNFPNAAVSYLTIPSSHNTFKTNPHLEELLIYDKRGKDAGLKGLFRLIADIRRRRFDTALLVHRSWRTALIARLAGIPRRIGYEVSSAGRLYTDRVPLRPGVYDGERCLDLLGPLGAAGGDSAPELHLEDGDWDAADDALAPLDAQRPWVAVAPAAAAPARTWYPERFVELLRRLRDERGVQSALLGGPNEVEVAQRVKSEVGDGVVNCAGRLTPRQSAAVTGRCDVTLSGDTGALHLAVGLGRPTVAICSITTLDCGFAPRGPMHLRAEVPLDCRPCAARSVEDCAHGTHACMDLVTVDDVYGKVTELLSSEYVGSPEARRPVST